MALSRYEAGSIFCKSKVPVSGTVVFHLSHVNERTRKKIVEALNNGCMFSGTGIAAEMYECVCQAYELPFVAVVRGRRSRYYGTDVQVNTEWRVRHGNSHIADNTKIAEIATADQMASRLAGEKVYDWTKYRAGTTSGWFWLSHLKDKGDFAAATRARYASPEIKDRLKDALEAVNSGAVITVPVIPPTPQEV